MLASIVATTGLSLLLYLSGFFSVLAPLPIALTGLKRGMLPAIVSFLLSLLILTVLYRLPQSPLSFLPMAGLTDRLGNFQTTVVSLINYFYYGWLGLTLAFAARRPETRERSYIGILISTLVIPGFLLFGFAKGFGFHPGEELRNGLQKTLEGMIDLQKKSGLEADEAGFLKQHASVIVSQIIRMIPGLWVNLSMVIVSINVLFLRRWGASESPFSKWVDYPLWRLGERVIWGPITFGFLYFINHYLFLLTPLETVCLNLLLVLGACYFFQGLAIVTFFFRQRFSPMTRLLGYFFVLLFLQLVGIVIMALGLFDFWFDFRKLKKVA